MSPAHVLEPTYRRLKGALVEGKFPEGSRLEALKLADEFGVSMTPVRDSLNQLVGEGLVVLTPGEGFRVAPLGEQDLRDILEVNLTLLEAAISAELQLPGQFGMPASADFAGRLAAVFSAIAQGSGNAVLVAQVKSISERIHRIRMLESAAIPGVDNLLGQIEASLRAPVKEQRRVLRRYHGQCRRNAGRLVRLLTDRPNLA